MTLIIVPFLIIQTKIFMSNILDLINKSLAFKVIFLTTPFLFLSSFAQIEIPDSLKTNSFNDLKNKFYEHEVNYKKSIIYANAYLFKAKKINDTIKIADGFYFLSSISKDHLFISYNDSIIKYTKNIKQENKFYPIIGYFNKGDYYYKKRKFGVALDNYLLAHNSDVNKKNLNYVFVLKHRIGLLKSRFGNDKEALKLFKKTHEYHEANISEFKNTDSYLSVLFALSDSYLRNKVIDSSNYYTTLGYKKTSIVNDSLYLNYFIFEQGLIEYEKKKYQSAIDSIKKALPYIIKNNDLANVSFGHHFLGKSYLNLKHYNKAIKSFKTVDSIYQITNDIHPDLRESYEYLIEHYKKENNLEKELEYVKKLLEINKNLNKNYYTINENFNENYNTPLLVSEKNRIISELENNILSRSTIIDILITISILILIFSIYQYKKRKAFKKHFDSIIKNEKYKLKEKKKKKENLKISQEIIDDLLLKLKLFENNNNFIEKGLTLNKLAKKFNTNTQYLSSIINNYKESNYSNYISSLRISYTIEKLKDDNKFRRYTIKAIAGEAGFSNSESFSKAFNKKTGIYPSLFIKELKKRSPNS